MKKLLISCIFSLSLLFSGFVLSDTISDHIERDMQNENFTYKVFVDFCGIDQKTCNKGVIQIVNYIVSHEKELNLCFPRNSQGTPIIDFNLLAQAARQLEAEMPKEELENMNFIKVVLIHFNMVYGCDQKDFI